MNWLHPHEHGRRLRLAYCQNLHAADSLDATIEGLRAITLPLASRLISRAARASRDRASSGRFGVGLYLPASVALPLAAPSGARDLERFAEFLGENALDAFTYNAFPFGGFHNAGLKSGVFRPTWEEDARVEFTLAVARIAARIARRNGGLEPPSHVSISTHSGRFGAFGADDAGRESARTCVRNMARVVAELARIESEQGIHIVLALEPEPRASANDVAALAPFLANAWTDGAELLSRAHGGTLDAARVLMRRHLGTCLDCCHAAVEFERDAVARWNASGSSLGKLQFSSALALVDPATNATGRARLFALDEPRYLHQVTGVDGERRIRCDDLADLRRAFESSSSATARDTGGARRSDWERCREWRCHFHVPVDLESLDDEAHGGSQDFPASGDSRTRSRDRSSAISLSTTRADADRMLAETLALESWRPPELHVEIETYTWDILPGSARGQGSLVDGLEREYAHVIGELERAGWLRE
jgi:hypothetical protein